MTKLEKEDQTIISQHYH